LKQATGGEISAIACSGDAGLGELARETGDLGRRQLIA